MQITKHEVFFIPKENPCFRCDPKIKGLCCYYSIPLRGFNVILTKHRCIYLNKKTRLCRKYKERNSYFLDCETGESGVGKGALPKGCSYLEGKEHLEKLPKIQFKKVRKYLSPEDILLYHEINNNRNAIRKPGMEVKT